MSVIDLTKEAFNARQVSELTGITRKQAIYWDKSGLVKPSVAPAAGRGSRRLYSYADIVALKAVKSMRDGGLSLQKIRRCVLYLRSHMPDVSQPLTFCSLIAAGETIYLLQDEDTMVDTVRKQGQRVFLQLSIAAIDRELRQNVLHMSTKRTQQVTLGDFAYQVEIEPDTEAGGYVAEVAGLPGCLTQGDTLEELLENVRDAIETYLEAVQDLADRGIHLPVERRRMERAGRA